MINRPSIAASYCSYLFFIIYIRESYATYAELKSGLLSGKAMIAVEDWSVCNFSRDGLGTGEQFISYSFDNFIISQDGETRCVFVILSRLIMNH
jgi:hypothetical protein